nr:hypothetical protein [Tanacetum cinerariifolium]
MERSLPRSENNNMPIETFDLGITISNQGSASLPEKWIRHVSSKTCLKELSLNISVSISEAPKRLQDGRSRLETWW